MAGVSVVVDLYRNGVKELSQIEGIRFNREGRTYLKYDRQDEEDTVNSLLTVAHDEIRIRQNGSIDADMHFRPERKADLIYTTSYGRMFFIIETRSISSEITVGKIRVKLDYRILTEEGEEVGSNEVIIEAKTVNN